MSEYNQNSNITARVNDALTVPCTYCGAKVGESCKERPRYPHKARTNLVMKERMKGKGKLVRETKL